MASPFSASTRHETSIAIEGWTRYSREVALKHESTMFLRDQSLGGPHQLGVEKCSLARLQARPKVRVLQGRSFLSQYTHFTVCHPRRHRGPIRTRLFHYSGVGLCDKRIEPQRIFCEAIAKPSTHRQRRRYSLWGGAGGGGAMVNWNAC